MERRNLIEESTYDGIFYFGTWIKKLRHYELDKSGNVPVGLDYLEVCEKRMLKCREDTNMAFEQFSEPMKEHLQALGTVLSLLDRLASCTWGCSRGDHVLEYITGRVVGYSQSAFLLAKSGLYDEALLIIRSISEVANLFALFVAEPASFSEWKTLSEGDRKSKFSPVKIRTRLESFNVVPPYDREQYGWLCEVAAHVTPNTKPQVHQPNTQPSVGAIFQQEGFQKVAKEASLAIASVSSAVVQLAEIEDHKRDEIMLHIRTLLRFI